MNRPLRPRRWFAPFVFAVSITAIPSAQADTLWYNGDYDGRDATVNQNHVPINMGGHYTLEKSLVYDNFVVPAGHSWTITSVFSNNQIAYPNASPTTATWEIRTGMSAGNGGTLVASGDSTATLTALTKVTGEYYAASPYQVTETISAVTLGPGTYWLAVAPDSAGYYGDQSYIETTSGANSIGAPQGPDGNSYINNNLVGPGALNFAPTTTVEGTGVWDYSMGVIGTTAIVVPEPGSLVIFTMGLLGSISMSRRRRKRRLSPLVDVLEARELLSSTPKGHHPTTQAEVRLFVERAERSSKIEADARVKSTSAVPPRELLNLRRSPLIGVKPQSSIPLAGPYNPTQVATAYGVTPLQGSLITTSGNPVTNEGQGQTIGIVDVFNDPNILSDTDTFSSQYGLPLMNGSSGNPLLTVYEDTALGTVSNSSTNIKSSNDTSAETSIDVQWAHAMAPMANILLVEVPAGSTVQAEFANLLSGIQYAAAHGATTVSLSYGDTESAIGSSTINSQNSTYLASGAASTIAVTVSTGDYAYPGYPATSPNVIGVGGTSLYLASARGAYSFETAWGGLSGAGAGGGGSSSVFAAPTFQSNNGVSCCCLSLPDVSLIADPVTSVSVYDSWDGQDWTAYGGTSVASPIFAGMLSLAQQQRVDLGKAPLTSLQINNAMYALYDSSSYSTYFHDITEGDNQDVGSSTTYYQATTGYDQATGIGSPIANTLIPYLASL